LWPKSSDKGILKWLNWRAVTKRPEKVTGMHFFNPQIMKLVEVVRGLHTSDETVEKVR